MFDGIEKIMSHYTDEKNQNTYFVRERLIKDHEDDEIKMSFKDHMVKIKDYATKLRFKNNALEKKEQLVEQMKENYTMYDPEVSNSNLNLKKNY